MTSATHRIEFRQRRAVHNIMRHVHLTIASDDDEEDECYDHYNECDQKQRRDRKEPQPVKEIIPSNAVKRDMRNALFRFLEASRIDEDDLVSLVKNKRSIDL